MPLDLLYSCLFVKSSLSFYYSSLLFLSEFCLVTMLSNSLWKEAYVVRAQARQQEATRAQLEADPSLS